MLASISILGFILSVLLLYFNARKFKSAIYLGGFFLSISLYGLVQYLVLDSKSVFLVSIFYNNFFFITYLAGPMLYWYVRSFLTDNPRLKRSDIWHLLPAIIHLIASLPYIFSSYNYKVQIAEAIVKDPSFLGTYHATFLSEIFSLNVLYLSRPVLVLVYTIWSIVIFIRYLIRKEQLKIFSNQRYVVKWLSVLLGFQLIIILVYLVSMFQTVLWDSKVFLTLNIVQVVSGIVFLILLISPLFFPGILYGMPIVPEQVVEEDEISGGNTSLQSGGKKSALHLEEDYLSAIDEKVNGYMEELKPYRTTDLNLLKFSVMLQVPAHHLAYYFRYKKNETFHQFRDEWRVKYARNLMENGLANGLTLEAIGLQSGFPNRNSFLIAFKRIEGVSPNAFVSKISV